MVAVLTPAWVARSARRVRTSAPYRLGGPAGGQVVRGLAAGSGRGDMMSPLEPHATALHGEQRPTSTTGETAMRRGTNLPRVAGFNQTVILDVVRRADSGLTRAQLARRTGLSAQTVTNATRRLLEQGLVREEGES